MQKSDVLELKIDYVEGDAELPHRVEIVGKDGSSYGAGALLSDALVSAFRVCKLFKGSKSDLANFIFWNFNGGGNWLKAIRALSNE